MVFRKYSYNELGNQSSQPRYGRLVIALVLVIFSVVSYLFSGSENPITGEVQRVGISTEQEIAMGLQALPEMMSQFGGELKLPERINKTGNALLIALQDYLKSQSREIVYPFDFHLLDDNNTINAFALPGGQVFITNALYRLLKTEGELAGVLAHEIGHVLSRHGAQQIAKQQLTTGLVNATGVATGDNNTAQVAAMIGNLVNLKYGRKAELEADKWGVKLVVLAGYNPESLIEVMHILDNAAKGNNQPDILSSHPKPANRIEYIKGVIRDEFPNGLP